MSLLWPYLFIKCSVIPLPLCFINYLPIMYGTTIWLRLKIWLRPTWSKITSWQKQSRMQVGASFGGSWSIKLHGTEKWWSRLIDSSHPVSFACPAVFSGLGQRIFLCESGPARYAVLPTTGTLTQHRIFWMRECACWHSWNLGRAGHTVKSNMVHTSAKT